MATNNPQKELKRQTVENLASCRDEIVTEIQRMRSVASPKLVVHRLWDRHKGTVVCVAITAGAASSMLILRNTRSSRLEHHPRSRIANKSERNTTIGPHILRVLIGSLLPVILKSAVVSPLYDSLNRSKVRREPSVRGQGD